MTNLKPMTTTEEYVYEQGRLGMDAALGQFDGEELKKCLAMDGLPSEEGCGEIDGEEELGREAALELYRQGERDELLERRAQAIADGKEEEEDAAYYRSLEVDNG